MRKELLIWCGILVGFLTSCGSVDVLNYDQLTPAEVFLPTQIKQIGVVNNMPLRSVPQKNILTLGLLEGVGEDCAEELAGMLADSKYFDEVIICDSALQSSSKVSENYQTQLTQSQVKALADELGVDMLVSFEQLWVQTSKENVKYPGWEAFLPLLQAKVTPVVRLYVRERPQPLHTITLTDSLYWDVNAGISESKVLKEAALLASRRVVDKLVPAWTPTERYYFTGGSVEMRDAGVWAREGDWKEAQKGWESLYNRLKKGNAKAKSAYNVALSCEMQGNVKEALQWIEKAKKYAKPDSQERFLIEHYSKDLVEREKQLSNLNIQMNRFQDNF